MTKLNTKIQSFIAISDVVSLLNMSCGFLSIINSMNNNLKIAAIFMIIAIIFDSIDGWIARKTNRNDELGFGKNIDSLCDVVSFGVAPAIFLYNAITSQNIPEIIVILVSLLIVVCGVLRLTRYNVISDILEGNDFIGFPIPGIGAILATYYLSGLYNPYIALILSIIVSFLMICNKKYPKIDNNVPIAIALVLIILIILPLNIVLFNINIPTTLLLLICLGYLIINLIKR